MRAAPRGDLCRGAGSAELPLHLLQLALQVVEPGQGLGVVLGRQVDNGSFGRLLRRGRRVSLRGEGLQGGPPGRQLLAFRYGGVRVDLSQTGHGLLHVDLPAAPAPAPATRAAADRLELSLLQARLLAVALTAHLLLALVVPYLFDGLVQAAHVLQQHERPGAEGLARGAQPAHDADLRQRPRHQALLAQRRAAGLLEGAVEEHGGRERHSGEELRGTRVTGAARRVHPVEPGRRAREGPHEQSRTERRVAVARLAHGEDGAEHRRPVQAEGHQVLPAPGEVEVLAAEADQAVEGERRRDGRAAEEEDVGGAAVDRFLAAAALLAAFPGVLGRRRLRPGPPAAGEHRNRRQHAQEQYGAGYEPVQRYVGHSHQGGPLRR
ncbi:putative transmembrane protein [Streptomyces sp. Tu6071]|nr:putative transmembrane protein [Streptomyces sp. Tu6071]